MKRMIEHIARRAGYEVIADWRVPRLPQARKLRRVFHELEIASVLDVGANIGQFRDFLRSEVGFKGQIHSFEPIASLAESMMRRRQGDPGWTIHPYALGAEEEEREINVTNSTVFSSFLAPRHEIAPEFAAMNTINRHERVKIRRLDDVVGAELGKIDLTRTFIKLDTQGFDVQVLRGGPASISRIPVLQTEVSILPIYDGMPDFVQAIGAFGAVGFKISDLFVVSEDKQLRAVEFDCVMVRPR